MRALRAVSCWHTLPDVKRQTHFDKVPLALHTGHTVTIGEVQSKQRASVPCRCWIVDGARFLSRSMLRTHASTHE